MSQTNLLYITNSINGSGRLERVLSVKTIYIPILGLHKIGKIRNLIPNYSNFKVILNDE